MIIAVFTVTTINVLWMSGHQLDNSIYWLGGMARRELFGSRRFSLSKGRRLKRIRSSLWKQIHIINSASKT